MIAAAIIFTVVTLELGILSYFWFLFIRLIKQSYLKVQKTPIHQRNAHNNCMQIKLLFCGFISVTCHFIYCLSFILGPRTFEVTQLTYSDAICRMRSVVTLIACFYAAKIGFQCFLTYRLQLTFQGSFLGKPYF